MIKNKVLKLSQSERDNILTWLGGDNYVENTLDISLGSTISFDYHVENILIKGTGMVLGFIGKLHERKVILLTPKGETMKLLFNSKLVRFKLVRKSRLKIRRAKLYYIQRAKLRR